MLLEMLFKTYPLSSCVLIQCFYSILHIQEQKRNGSFFRQPQNCFC